MLELLRPGDESVVTFLRLGRATRDPLNLIEKTEQRGTFVTVFDPHVSTRGRWGTSCCRARHGGPDGTTLHRKTANAIGSSARI